MILPGTFPIQDMHGEDADCIGLPGKTSTEERRQTGRPNQERPLL